MSESIRSRPYSTAAACERCCFGRGPHAAFCPQSLAAQVTPEMLEIIRPHMTNAWPDTIEGGATFEKLFPNVPLNGKRIISGRHAGKYAVPDGNGGWRLHRA